MEGGRLMETEVQNGACSTSWPGKVKINTQQPLHSSARYLARPCQELLLLPSLPRNYCACKQPPRRPRPHPSPGRQTMGQKTQPSQGLSLQPPESVRLGNTKLFLMSYLSTNCGSMA